MIYTKQANFPYPLLYNDSNDYSGGVFDLDVDLCEDNEEYILHIKSDISSEFLKNLILSKQAQLYLIIQSRDNQYHKINNIGLDIIRIPKNQLSFVKNKSLIQLIIQSKDLVSFKENNDLNEFYLSYKNEIEIEKGLALGFSNVVSFDGSQENPYKLFEKRLDENIVGDIEFDITHEVIVIKYKSEDIMFSKIPQNRNLINTYFYLGLQKQLFVFFNNYSAGNDDIVVRELHINDMNSALDEKILSLLKSKAIENLSIENIDEIIYLISSNIIKKYVDRIGVLYNNAD